MKKPSGVKTFLMMASELLCLYLVITLPYDRELFAVIVLWAAHVAGWLILTSIAA